VKFIANVFAELIRGAALLLAAGSALFALAAQGGRFSDRLDALTHAAPILVAGGLFALVGWAVSGRTGRTIPALAIVAGLSAFSLMAPELLAAATQKRVAASDRTLKVLQFNIWYLNKDVAGTVAWIEQEDPDIIVIEEGYARSGGTARALRGRYPHVTTCDDPRPCSTMILSKIAPTAEGGLATRGSQSWLSGAWATYPGNGRPFTVIGVHYTWPWPAGPQQQQTLRLNNVVQGFPKEDLIVAGDFNSTPWSFSLKKQDRLFGLERRTRGVFSWPAGYVSERLGIKAPFPVLAIDQVYAGSAWRTVSVRRGPKLGSDHYPVVIELARADALAGR
jgi:endonuclease/exonuclease/phosphatase (EEP) superfamily protein YafD